VFNPRHLKCKRGQHTTFQVENIYEKGGRAFLFLTVPPTNRAPLWIEQGTEWTTKMADAIADYNGQLASRVKAFQANHTDLAQVVLFDTGSVFNTLLDNAETFGYVNITGYCEAYANGIAGTTTQVLPCAPLANYLCVSFILWGKSSVLRGSYSWLNTLHPLYTVHK
jgi:phospholipase/lecithinase/hemolysin